MSRTIKISIMLAVLLVAVFVVVQAAPWLWMQIRPDPAAKVIGAGFQPRHGESPDQDLAILLEGIRSRHNLPALAAAAIGGGKVIAMAAVGARRAGGAEAVTVDDRFHLGSDTKAMTATLIAILGTEGKLSWSATVGEVFGETIKDMDAAWRPVTLSSCFVTGEALRGI